MAYLPPGSEHSTVFPTKYGKDAQLQVRLASEQYKRYRTPILYYPLLLTPTSTGTPEDPKQLLGGDGETKYDPLWGESIDNDLTTWEQPHRNADEDVKAGTDSDRVYGSPVTLHVNVRREAKDSELKLWGFDRMRDLLLFVPLSVLDEEGVTVRAGDKFLWDSGPLQVLQYNADGYWKNTNLRFFMIMNCEHLRGGS